MKSKQKALNLYVHFFLFCFVFLNTIFFKLSAAQVKSVKDKKVLIEFNPESEKFKPEQILDLFLEPKSETEKPQSSDITNNKARIKVLQIRNNQAVFEILSGNLQANQNFKIQNKVTKNNGPQNTDSQSQISVDQNRQQSEEKFELLKYNLKRGSIYIKALSNSITSKQADTSGAFPVEEDVTMTGTNVGFGMSYDWPETVSILKSMTLRFHLLYEPLKVTGTAQGLSCDKKTSRECSTEINYLSLGGFARFDLYKSRALWWTALGTYLKAPINKKSTALNEADLQMANTITVNLGLDYLINRKSYIPLFIEYSYSLNQSETVPKINQLGFALGYGISF